METKHKIRKSTPEEHAAFLRIMSAGLEFDPSQEDEITDEIDVPNSQVISDIYNQINQTHI